MGSTLTPSPKTIQTLRKRLGESTHEFGARFSRSGRSIEDWEQGRRAPDAMCSQIIRDLGKKPGTKAAAPTQAKKKGAPKKAAKKVARRVAP